MKEVLDLSKNCMKQVILLVNTFPTVRIHFPYFNRLLSQDSGDRENLQIIKLAILNVSYILIKYQRNTVDFRNFFLDFIVSTNTKYQKGILFTCKILLQILRQNNDLAAQQVINQKLKDYLKVDVQKCQDENVLEIQQKIKLIEDGYAQKNLPSILSFQESAALIQSLIPHFTIRFIVALEISMKPD